MSDDADLGGETRPLLRVVHGGDPSPEEIAALVVALDSVSGATAAATPARSRWADRRSLVREPLDHGPGRWVARARRSR